MLDDIINKKLEENRKYGDFYDSMIKKQKIISNLRTEQDKTYHQDKKLEHFALIGQIIVPICCLINMHSLISYLVVFIARKKAEKITRDNMEMYDRKISLLIRWQAELNEILNDIYYNTCDEVEKQLEPLKEEAKQYLASKNYEMIISNFHNYENVLPLIADEGNLRLIYTLCELARNGININSLSKEELEFLDSINYISLEKQNNEETLGERLRRLNEARLEHCIQNGELEVVNIDSKQKKRTKRN